MILAEATAAEGWVALGTTIGFIALGVLTVLNQRIGRSAERIAKRVERQVTPNGGSTPTTGDATVRLEEGQAHLHRRVDHVVTLIHELTTALRQAVGRDDGRFGRLERELAALRDRYDRDHPTGGAA